VLYSTTTTTFTVYLISLFFRLLQIRLGSTKARKGERLGIAEAGLFL